MFGKLCAVFVFSVSDGIHVAGKSLLECVFCWANVCVGFVGVVFWGDFCVVDDAGFLAVAFQGAVFLVSAITTLFGIFCGFSCDVFVV